MACSIIESSWSVRKVRVLKGLLCRDPSGWLILKHFSEQVKALVVNLFGMDELSQIHNLVVVWPLRRGELGILHDAGPCLLIGLTHDAEDFLKLHGLIFTLEKRCIDSKLCKDAANRPDIDRSGILVQLQQKFGTAIIQSNDTLGVRLDRD